MAPARRFSSAGSWMSGLTKMACRRGRPARLQTSLPLSLRMDRAWPKGQPHTEGQPLMKTTGPGRQVHQPWPWLGLDRPERRPLNVSPLQI